MKACPCYFPYKIDDRQYKVLKCKLPHLKILGLNRFRCDGVSKYYNSISGIKASTKMKFFTERYDDAGIWVPKEINEPTRTKPVRCADIIVEFECVDDIELEIETCQNIPSEPEPDRYDYMQPFALGSSAKISEYHTQMLETYLSK